MRRSVLTLTATLLALLTVSVGAASADRAFQPRYQSTQRGDVNQLGNTILSCNPSTQCDAARNGTGSVTNDNFAMNYIDTDSSSVTFDSSSSDLALPPGVPASNVLFAGLYWAGDTAAGTGGSQAPTPTARNSVRLTTPTQSLLTVTASALDADAAKDTRYQAFADVTSSVRAGGSGSYSVGNVQTGTGGNGFGGWALIVVYKDPMSAVKRLSVYDGWQSVGQNDPYSGTITGIETPPTGSVVSNLGMVAWEGDRVLDTGEAFKFSGTALSNPVNPTSNTFNSTITRNGSAIATRNPAFIDSLGVDNDVFNANGVLTNGQTTASVEFTSGADQFYPGVFTLTSDQAANAPSNSSPPGVTGTARDGQTLNASNGTWSGTGPIDYSYQWRRCNAAGASCTDISGATGQSYTLTPADVGSAVRVRVTAENVVTASSADSNPTAAVAASPPANTAPPTVTGMARDGQLLSVSTGTWTGTPTISYTYQWRRCDSAGANCSDISGATGQTYQLVSADAGRTVRAVVTAANAGGSTPATTASTGPVAAVAPANTSPPTISGPARDGAALTATDGVWTGSTPQTYAYQWRRCDAAGANCTNISGANAKTYTQTSADVGATLRVVVTATNTAGSTPATSTQTGSVAATSPASTAPPIISGAARDGQTLTTTNGSWSGTTPLTYSYQWLRCDSAGANCTNIPSANSSSYTQTAADVGSSIRVVVTAANVAGSAPATAAKTATVAATPPANTSAPTVSGAARDGQTLSVSQGTWTGTPTITYAYQWQRCDSAGANCQSIAGATSSSYVLRAVDIGARLRAVVTATNGAGSTPANAAPSATVTGAAPVNSGSAPSIDGDARDGATLTADHGEWSGTDPISYAYQWRRCDAGGINCVDISGATNPTYTLASADKGSRLRVRVTATNAYGSAQAASPGTGLIAAAPPVNTAPPTITGTQRDGSTVSATTGSWNGTSPISYAYRWRRCDSAGANCADIAGATSSSYTLAPADVGKRLRVAVTASNEAGNALATSAPAAQATPLPPTNVTPPSVTGTTTDEQTLTAETGSWNGTAPLTYAYQWRRCDSAGANCADIAGATGRTYRVVPDDVGGRLRVVVTATNGGGSAPATSSPSAPISPAPPSNRVPPSISGKPQDGRRLTANDGQWNGTPPIAFAYQWQRCDDAGSACADIAGATNKTYDLTGADVGGTIRVRVRGTSGSGNQAVTSDATSQVLPLAPSSTVAPTTSGTPRSGELLAVTQGSWSGPAPITYSYSWQRCAADGSDCEYIPGADDRTYRLTDADIGKRLRGVVTATNPGGPTTRTSGNAIGPVAGIAPANRQSPPAPAVPGSGGPTAGATLVAQPGDWSGSAPLSYAYQWQRCDSAGRDCASIPGATGRTYTLTPDDSGRVVRVVVTASNPAGSRRAISAGTRVGRAAARPATVDLGDVPGSLVGYKRCQRSATGSKLRRIALKNVGRSTLRVRSRSVVSPSAPLVIGYFGRRTKIRSISYTLDGKRIGTGRGRNFLLRVKPSRLGRPGRHIFAFRIRLRTGKLVRSKKLRIGVRTARCLSLLSGRRSVGRRRQLLLARVDSTAPLTTVSFRVPKSLMPRMRRGRAAGTLRIVSAGPVRKRSYRLKVGRRGVLLKRVGAPAVRLARGKILVSGLPANAAIVAVEVSGAKRGGRVANRIRARVKRTQTPRNLNLKAKIRRR